MNDWYSSGTEDQRKFNASFYSNEIPVSGADMGGGFKDFHEPTREKTFHASNIPSHSYPSGLGFNSNEMNFQHPSSRNFSYVGNYENEPPLLEELGINFEHIIAKTRAVLVPTQQIDSSYLDETDLMGPLVFALIFGTCLLFTGKIHFGYIYGFGLFGCISLYLVLNLMAEKSIDIWRTGSVLGYCLLPVVLLSAVGILVDLTGNVGLALSGLAIFWSCTAATKLFEQYLDMRRQRWLIAYPICLLYCSFVLLTIF